MPTAYREIGKEILDELEVDTTRLGEALSTLSRVVKDCLENDTWNEVPVHCATVQELRDVVEATYAEGIFHTYRGVCHLYQAQEAKEKKNSSEEHEELAKAIDCLEQSQRSFHAQYRDHWNEVVICLNLGRLYRSQNNQNKLKEALLAFQKSLYIFTVHGLSTEKRQKIVNIALEGIEETCNTLLGLEANDSGDREDRTAQEHREKHSDARSRLVNPSPQNWTTHM
jgi:hypothetical protein